MVTSYFLLFSIPFQYYPCKSEQSCWIMFSIICSFGQSVSHWVGWADTGWWEVKATISSFIHWHCRGLVEWDSVWQSSRFSWHGQSLICRWGDFPCAKRSHWSLEKDSWWERRELLVTTVLKTFHKFMWKWFWHLTVNNTWNLCTLCFDVKSLLLKPLLSVS